MKLEWMGEYRDFVEKMIKYGNAYATRCQKEYYFGSEILFSPSQLQTMEYILESEDQHQSMVEIAARLGVSTALTTLIAAAMTGTFYGLGSMIQTAQIYFRMDKVLLGIICIGAIGFVLDRLLLLAEKRITRWK